MNDRKARGSPAAHRTKGRLPRRLGVGSARRSARNPSRDGDEQSTPGDQLSEDIAEEHQAQLNQLRDEPMRSSHYYERDSELRQREDGQD